MTISDWVEQNPNKFYLSGLGLLFTIGFLSGLIGIYDVFTEEQIDTILTIITWIILLPISVITLKIKNRSLWWMLLWGIFSPLWLKNFKQTPDEIKIEKLEAENIKLKNELKVNEEIAKIKDGEEIVI